MESMCFVKRRKEYAGCRPLYAEQMFNRVMMVEEMVKAEEVEEQVKELMVGEEHDFMKMKNYLHIILCNYLYMKMKIAFDVIIYI